MPRNGSGLASLAEAPFVAGTPILSADMNSDLDDIVDMLTDSIAADGQTPITGPILFSPGTVSLPGIAWTIDPDTGLYRISADSVGMACGGTLVQSWAVGASSIIGTFDVAGRITATLTTAGLPALKAVLTEDGAGSGPYVELFRDSASPAASDTLGQILLYGNSSTGAKRLYGYITVQITDPTNGSEDSEVSFGNIIAGVQTTFLKATAIGVTLTGTVSATAGVTAATALSGATAAGAMIATQAEQETGSAIDKLVTPGRQQFHASAAKAWIKFTGSTGAVLASYNCTVTRNAVGDYTILFTVPMSSAHFVGQVTCSGIAGAGVNIPVMDRTAAGVDAPPSTAGQRFAVFNAAAGFAAADPDRVYYEAHGDQ